MAGLKGLPLIALALLLAVTLQSVKCLDKKKVLYMSPSSKGFGQMNSGRLIDALEALRVPDGATPEWIKEAIDYEVAVTRDPDHARQYKILQTLSDQIPACAYTLISAIKHLVHLVLDEKNPVALDFKDYLTHYGKEKFELCAKPAISLYLNEADERMELALDEYFGTAMGVNKKKINDEQWLEKLKEFSLDTSHIDMNPLLNMAKWSRSKKSETNEMLLAKLTEDRCSSFATDKNKIHDMLALARVFGSQMQVDPRFLKLTEYRRLCLTFISKRDEVMENFRQFLPEEKPKQSFLSKFSCMSADCQDVAEPTRKRS